MTPSPQTQAYLILLTLRKVYAMADPSSTTGPFDLETWVEETLQQPWLVGGLSDEELEVLSTWAGAVLLDGRLWQSDGILHGTCGVCASLQFRQSQRKSMNDTTIGSVLVAGSPPFLPHAGIRAEIDATNNKNSG